MKYKGIHFTKSLDTDKLNKNIQEAHKTAMKKTALFLSTRMVTEEPKPPILTGHLRRSYGVYYDKAPVHEGVGAPTEPSVIGESDNNTIVFTYQTAYATKMHEREGAFPSQSQDPAVGSQFVTRHLYKDADLFSKLYARNLKEGRAND